MDRRSGHCVDGWESRTPFPSPYFIAVHTQRNEILTITLEERLHCSCSGLLVLALDGELYGIAALDAQTHHAHDALGIDFLFRAGDHDFRGKLACLLDQQARRSSVDAQCILDGIFNGFHGEYFLSVTFSSVSAVHRLRRPRRSRRAPR